MYFFLVLLRKIDQCIKRKLISQNSLGIDLNEEIKHWFSLVPKQFTYDLVDIYLDA